jgi:hypothetical protein
MTTMRVAFTTTPLFRFVSSAKTGLNTIPASRVTVVENVRSGWIGTTTPFTLTSAFATGTPCIVPVTRTDGAVTKTPWPGEVMEMFGFGPPQRPPSVRADDRRRATTRVVWCLGGRVGSSPIWMVLPLFAHAPAIRWRLWNCASVDRTPRGPLSANSLAWDRRRQATTVKENAAFVPV